MHARGRFWYHESDVVAPSGSSSSSSPSLSGMSHAIVPTVGYSSSSSSSSGMNHQGSGTAAEPPFDVVYALELHFTEIYDATEEERPKMIRRLYLQYHPDKNAAPYAGILFDHIKSFWDSLHWGVTTRLMIMSNRYLFLCLTQCQEQTGSRQDFFRVQCFVVFIWRRCQGEFPGKRLLETTWSSPRFYLKAMPGTISRQASSPHRHSPPAVTKKCRRFALTGFHVRREWRWWERRPRHYAFSCSVYVFILRLTRWTVSPQFQLELNCKSIRICSGLP